MNVLFFTAVTCLLFASHFVIQVPTFLKQINLNQINKKAFICNFKIQMA